MKKVLIFFVTTFVFGFALLFASCVSSAKISGFEKLPESARSYYVLLQSVNLSIDQVSDKVLEKQLSEIITSHLCRDKKEKLHLYVSFSEKKFYKGINDYHSIYMSFQLFNDVGTCVMQHCFGMDSKNSINSTNVQHRLISVMIEKINDYIQKAENL